MTRIRLIVPAPLSTLSGGYAYDRAMLAGLRALGADVSVAELPGQHPLPDDAALAAAAQAWRELPDDAVPLIDGLGLPAFAPLAPLLEARGAVGLIHHPTALETGRDADSRARLQAIERALFARLRRIVVTSADTARRLSEEFAVDAARISVVEPGTPDAPRSPGPLRAPGCDILSIGTLTPRKGHDVLLRALARLHDLDVHLTIVGGGHPDYQDELARLATASDLSGRVTFAGALTPDALAPYWERAGVFALATYYEGYGMAIAESFRRGIPVAVTADAGLAARIPPEAGVSVPPGEHVALSNALRRLLFDVDLRRAMADAAWAHGRTLPDWPAQAQLLAAALAA
jgi:glycosyltransferase involved in cell wall biosynthesis